MKLFAIILLGSIVFVAFVKVSYHFAEKYAGNTFFFKKAKGIAERIVYGKSEENMENRKGK